MENSIILKEVWQIYRTILNSPIPNGVGKTPTQEITWKNPPSMPADVPSIANTQVKYQSAYKHHLYGHSLLHLSPLLDDITSSSWNATTIQPDCDNRLTPRHQSFQHFRIQTFKINSQTLPDSASSLYFFFCWNQWFLFPNSSRRTEDPTAIQNSFARSHQQRFILQNFESIFLGSLCFSDLVHCPFFFLMLEETVLEVQSSLLLFLPLSLLFANRLV